MHSDQSHGSAIHFGRYAHRPVHALIDILERGGCAARIPEGIVLGALVHIVRTDEGMDVCADLSSKVVMRN